MSFFRRKSFRHPTLVEIDDAVLTITEKDAAKIEFPLSRTGARFFRIVALFILIILGSRVFHLTIVEGPRYRAIAERNSVRSVPLSAPRGIIYDRYGTQLVRNVPGMELLVFPDDLPADDAERRAFLDRLATIVSLDSGAVESLMISSNEAYSSDPIVAKASLSREESLIFLSRATEFPGVRIEQAAIRQYVDGLIFSPVIGYEAKIRKEEFVEYPEALPTDSVGKQGVEKSYETILRGTRGASRMEVNSIGAVQGNIGSREPVPGDDLILTIDADLQKRLFDSLTTTLEREGLAKGAAVAVDPRDGSVLALVSVPSFDNNLFADGIDVAEYAALVNDPTLPLFNRVLSGEYPPGSTVKPFLAAAALTEGVVSPETKIESRGGITVSGFSFGDWKAHGFTDIRQAIAVSSDVYFYSVGGGYGNIRGMGMDTMKKYEETFGLGMKTGIDLPGERPGFLPDATWKETRFGERWYIGDTYNASIGQGYVLSTPIQLALATAAVANGGNLWKPHVVGQIRHRDGSVSTVMPESTRADIVDPEILRIVREGMRLTVTEGTATSLNTLSVAVAGKTGTAQFGTENRTHGWFEAFAPYENPSIVLVILVENQDLDGYHAVPITKDVLEWYFSEGKGNVSL